MPKRQYKPPTWRFNYDLKDKNKKFTAMYHNQLSNQNFMKLSNASKVVYLYMSDYSNGQQITKFPNKINKTLMSRPTFDKCINELEENGFIEVIERGRNNHRPNVYKFSDRWYK